MEEAIGKRSNPGGGAGPHTSETIVKQSTRSERRRTSERGAGNRPFDFKGSLLAAPERTPGRPVTVSRATGHQKAWRVAKLPHELSQKICGGIIRGVQRKGTLR